MYIFIDHCFSNCTSYHTCMFHSLKMLPKACLEQKVSGEQQDHWSSDLSFLETMLRIYVNSCPAEPGYALLLQTV